MTVSQPADFVMLDPCLAPPTFSLQGFFLFTMIFLIMTAGSVALFFLFFFFFLGDEPLGTQIAAVVGYTAVFVFYTFSVNRGMPRYLSLPGRSTPTASDATRHVCRVLLVLLTAALPLRPLMPPSWLVASGGPKSMPRLTTVLLILSGCLAVAEILTNRSLASAHNSENSGPSPA